VPSYQTTIFSKKGGPLPTKPVVQQFSDELTELVRGYKDSGLSNAEAIGAIVIYLFDLLFTIRRAADRRERPY
jgi:hypothetical protein